MATNRNVILIISVAVIMLILGVGLGSTLFVQSTTLTSIVTVSVTPPENSSTVQDNLSTTTEQALCCYATTFTTSASIITSSLAQVTGANSSTVPPDATICNEMAEGTIQLTILNSATNKTVPNVSAEASTLTSNGFPTPCTLRLVTQTLTSGANGTVSFCCDTGYYNVTVRYSDITYLIQTVIEPERCTGVTLFVPTGKTIVTTSQDFGSCPAG